MERSAEVICVSFCMLLCMPPSASVTNNCSLGIPVEGKPYVLECTGISPSQTVQWRRGSSGGGIVASCDDVNICTVNDPTRYNVSRPTATTSSLVIFSLPRDDDSTWTCLSGAQPSACTLPQSIYPPELSAPCTAELTLEGTVAKCRIDKVYPTPECSWFESITLSNGTEFNTTIPSSSEETQLESVSSFTDGGKVYFRATCTLRRNVTYVEGTYSYVADIAPASVMQNVQFQGSATVKSPSPPVLENCSPNYTLPSQEVVCTCKVTELGWPLGHVTWMDQWDNVIRSGTSHSVQLLIQDIPKESGNSTYTCEVRSANNFRLTANYIPSLAFGPDDVMVKGPLALIAPDDQSVTLTCTAFGVNPQPDFQWQGHGEDAVFSTVSAGDKPLSYKQSVSFVPTKEQNGNVVTCYVRNSVFNSPGAINDSSLIALIVNGTGTTTCTAEKFEETPLFLGLVIGFPVCIVALIIVFLVIICDRRSRTAGDSFRGGGSHITEKNGALELQNIPLPSLITRPQMPVPGSYDEAYTDEGANGVNPGRACNVPSETCTGENGPRPELSPPVQSQQESDTSQTPLKGLENRAFTQSEQGMEEEGITQRSSPSPAESRPNTQTVSAAGPSVIYEEPLVSLHRAQPPMQPMEHSDPADAPVRSRRESNTSQTFVKGANGVNPGRACNGLSESCTDENGYMNLHPPVQSQQESDTSQTPLKGLENRAFTQSEQGMEGEDINQRSSPSPTESPPNTQPPMRPMEHSNSTGEPDEFESNSSVHQTLPKASYS